jgi:hypothetical protein
MVETGIASDIVAVAKSLKFLRMIHMNNLIYVYLFWKV